MVTTCWLAVASAIVANVPVEPIAAAGYTRQSVMVDLSTPGQVLFMAGATFGPAIQAWQGLSVAALIDVDTVTVLHTMPIGPYTVPAAHRLSFGSGPVAATALGQGPAAKVLVLSGQPVRSNGAPLTLG